MEFFVSLNADMSSHLSSGFMTFFFKLFFIFQSSDEMRLSSITRLLWLQYPYSKAFQEVSRFTGLSKLTVKINYCKIIFNSMMMY